MSSKAQRGGAEENVSPGPKRLKLQQQQQQQQQQHVDLSNPKMINSFTDVNFEVVVNDRSDEACEKLVTLKNIFSRQLPKMPKEYIVRLVFDHRHISLAIVRDKKIIGGICYRPYYEQRFGEIAFCAISATEQVRGYGTHLMNQLKHHVQKDKIEYFLTYADNFAIGYFQKQGFSKSIAMPKERWVGFIKDYDGGTLMECYIHPGMDYLGVGAIVARQRSFICERVHQQSQLETVYPGLQLFKNGKRLSTGLDAPGVREAGWTPLSVMGTAATSSERDRNMNQTKLNAQLKTLFDKVRLSEHAWAFDVDGGEEVTTSSGGGGSRSRAAAQSQSQSQQLAAAYETFTDAELLEDPENFDSAMNLALIGARLRLGDFYRSYNMMAADLIRMIAACRKQHAGESVSTSPALVAVAGMETLVLELFGVPAVLAASVILVGPLASSSSSSSSTGSK